MRPLAATAATLISLATPAAAADDGGSLPHLGLVLDAGVPSGAGLLVQVRAGPVRVNAGPMWSGLGYGVKGGLVLAPFAWAVAPELELDGGYCPRANLSRLAGHGVPEDLRGVLARSSYSFASGLVGLELGSPRRFSFFLRAGLSRLVVRAPRSATSPSSGGSGSTLDLGNATVRAVIPCAKLGFQLWF